VKHELKGSPYNERRLQCEHVAEIIAKRHPEVESLRDATMEMLDEVKDDITGAEYKRARYVIGEVVRVLAVCKALEADDYEKVGQMMYDTHYGLSKEYEVSCEELDYLNDIAKECGVTGSRIMGGGFGGCTINLVRNDIYSKFIADAKKRFNEKYGHESKVYDVNIGDGSRKLC
jgi:galactokinase